MKKLNIPLLPVISGTLALAAVIAVIVIVLGAGSGAGLYITSASGSVSITNSDSSVTDSSSGEALQMGDIITVGSNSSCVLTYKSSKNSENNYISVGPDSQIVINSKFSGKEDGEIFLYRGSLMCSLAGSDKARFFVRTADSMVYPEGTVSKIRYSTEGFEAYTDVHTFMGNSRIQLYDSLGNTVNEPEYLVEKRAGRVTTNDLGPEFSYLNIEFALSELTAADLKELITICNLVEGFPYTLEELKAAYDAKAGTEEQVTTIPSDTSEEIQTAAPITTVPSETSETKAATTGPAITARPQTTTAAQTAAQTTTKAPAPAETTTTASRTNTDETFVVVVIVGDEETIQEVAYGEDAEQPEDPVIEGKRFIGWDKSFKNITEDTTITAMFEDDSTVTTSVSTSITTSDTEEMYHTVTIVILDKQTQIQVKHGESANLPTTVEIEGYDFLGWDKDFTCITESTTITAILKEQSSVVTVIFSISGLDYPQTIERGGTAVPPFIPEFDLSGRPFIGWDKSLVNITEDTTITALFGQEEYTVTFIIDGVEYKVKVKSGEDAVPPFIPEFDSKGRTFIGWDGSFLAVTSDLIITAIFI